MIPDLHVTPAEWGIRPVLFTVRPYEIAAYSFFLLFGLLAAIGLFFYNTRGKRSGNGLTIAAAALVGGIIGAKLPIWIANAPALLHDPSAAALLSGRTIVGGIVGGALTVFLVKRKLGIKERLGNYLVPSLLLGVFFGRLGCFLAGCCYGATTALPWGVDFGDELLRHPTQLYEALFVLGLFLVAQVCIQRLPPGRLFDLFMVAYFGWRFVVEFIRVNPSAALGLTYYQLVAAGVVLLYASRMCMRSLGGSLDERDLSA